MRRINLLILILVSMFLSAGVSEAAFYKALKDNQISGLFYRKGTIYEFASDPGANFAVFTDTSTLASPASNIFQADPVTGRVSLPSNPDGYVIEGVVIENGAITAIISSATVTTDTIVELTPAAGITIDGVLLKDFQVSTDVINELTATVGVTVDGVLLKDTQVTADWVNSDTLTEKTLNNGVAIEGITLKDSQVTTAITFLGTSRVATAPSSATDIVNKAYADGLVGADHVSTSAGAGDNAKGVLLSGAGQLDNSFINESALTVANQTRADSDYANFPLLDGTRPMTGALQSDAIDEATATVGVTVDGVLLKDSQVSTDQINEKTATAGVTIDGVLLKDTQVTADWVNSDTLAEKTLNNGVAIEGITFKDSQVTTAITFLGTSRVSSAPVSGTDIANKDYADSLVGAAHVSTSVGAGDNAKGVLLSGSGQLSNTFINEGALTVANQTRADSDYANFPLLDGTRPMTGALQVDTISETTPAAGVTADGVLLKDFQVSTDTINELTATVGVTIDGVLLKDGVVTADTINETTPAAGVTADGVLLKDAQVNVDVINEATATVGVTVDGVLLKDGVVTTDQVNEATPDAGVTVDQVLVLDKTLSVGMIKEATGAGGTHYSGASFRLLDPAGLLITNGIQATSGTTVTVTASHDLEVTDLVAGEITGIAGETLGTTINGVTLRGGIVNPNIQTTSISERNAAEGVVVEATFFKDDFLNSIVIATGSSPHQGTTTRIGTEGLRAIGDAGLGASPADPGEMVAVFQNNALTGTSAILNVISGDTGSGLVAFSDKDANTQGAVTYDHSDDSLAFSTGGTERLRIDAAGLTSDTFLLSGPVSPTTTYIGAETIRVIGPDGIGASPGDPGEVVAVFQNNILTGTSSILNVISGDTGSGLLAFSDKDGLAQGGMEYDHQDNALSLSTDGTDRIRIITGGDVGIGTISPEAELEVVDETQADIFISTHNNGVTNFANLALRRSRGTEASQTTVVTGDILSTIVTNAHDGTNLVEESSMIRTYAEGTISTGIVPGALTFWTSDAGGVIREAFRTDSAQNFGIGVAPTKRLDVLGDFLFTNSGTGGPLGTMTQTAATNHPVLKLNTFAGGNGTDKHGLHVVHAANGYSLYVEDDLGNPQLSMDSGRQMGISTDTAAARLDIFGPDGGLTLSGVSSDTTLITRNMDLEGAGNNVYHLSENSGSVRINMGDQDDVDSGFINYGNANDTMTLGAAAGTRLTINATQVQVASGVNLGMDSGAGAPADTRCDAAAEGGGMYYDTTALKLYICNGAGTPDWNVGAAFSTTP